MFCQADQAWMTIRELQARSAAKIEAAPWSTDRIWRAALRRRPTLERR
jgi:hypothetical protein